MSKKKVIFATNTNTPKSRLHKHHYYKLPFIIQKRSSIITQLKRPVIMIYKLCMYSYTDLYLQFFSLHDYSKTDYSSTVTYERQN